jgi:GAF domain-containing protein/HAMP domain-containing protein
MSELQTTVNLSPKSSVRSKLLASIAPVMLALIIITAALSSYNDWQRLQNQERNKLDALFDNYTTFVSIEEKTAGALAVSFADRDDIRQLFNSKNRDGLLKLLSPVFNTIKKEYNVVHLYVEDTQGRVFLRVHNPSQFGDDITYRRTAAAALRTRKPVAGIEIGPSRLGIRGVAPIEKRGRFEGLIEVGIDYDQAFLEELKSNTSADYTMWVSYDAAQPAGLKPVEGSPESPSSKMFYYASTMPVPLPIEKEAYERVLASNQPEILYITTDEGPWAVYLAPLKGFGNNTIGIFEIVLSRSQVISEIINSAITTTFFALAIGAASMALIWLIAQIIVIRPLSALTQFSRKQMEGDLTARVTLSTNDEFYELGSIINQLSTRVQEIILSLETRVAERTAELEIASGQTARRAEQLQIISELSRNIATISNLDLMLRSITQLVSEKFGFYHVGIFLLNDEKEYAVLRASNSEGGQRMLARGHKLKIGVEGIVGYVTAQGRPRIALDVGEDASYFDNPDLPNTHSEIALPLIANDQIIGALDVQSDKPAAFTQEDANILSTLANQIAISLENARLYSATEEALAEVEKRFSAYTESSWKTFAAGSDVKGYRSSTENQSPIYDLAEKPSSRGYQVLEIPVKLRGTTIGTLGIKTATREPYNESQLNIIEAATERMALALETARLFREAQRRADRERTISEVSSKISASSDVEEIMRTTVSELQKILGVPEVFIEVKNDDE